MYTSFGHGRVIPAHLPSDLKGSPFSCVPEQEEALPSVQAAMQAPTGTPAAPPPDTLGSCTHLSPGASQRVNSRGLTRPVVLKSVTC